MREKALEDRLTKDGLSIKEHRERAKGLTEIESTSKPEKKWAAPLRVADLYKK